MLLLLGIMILLSVAVIALVVAFGIVRGDADELLSAGEETAPVTLTVQDRDDIAIDPKKQASRRSRSKSLTVAAREGDVAAIKRALQKGMDPDKRNWRNGTPLQQAAIAGDLEIVKLLVEAGADVNRRGDTYQKPLHFAAQSGHAKIVEYLLAHGAEISRSLHATAFKGNVDIARILLKHKADINEKGTDEATPLATAVLYRQAELVRFFLEHGADVNSRGLYGSTPLHVAASKNDLTIARMLLDHGANPALECNGRAVRSRSEEFRQLLETHEKSR